MPGVHACPIFQFSFGVDQKCRHEAMHHWWCQYRLAHPQHAGEPSLLGIAKKLSNVKMCVEYGINQTAQELEEPS